RLLEEVTGDGGEGDHVSPGVNGSPAPQVEIVTDPHHVVSAWNADKDKDTSIALYPVYDGSPPHDMHLIGIAWATEEQVVYIPWSRKKGDNGDSKDRELILETIF